jgi:hypothetical protein
MKDDEENTASRLIVFEKKICLIEDVDLHRTLNAELLRC